MCTQLFLKAPAELKGKPHFLPGLTKGSDVWGANWQYRPQIYLDSRHRKQSNSRGERYSQPLDQSLGPVLQRADSALIHDRLPFLTDLLNSRWIRWVGGGWMGGSGGGGGAWTGRWVGPGVGPGVGGRTSANVHHAVPALYSAVFALYFWTTTEYLTERLSRSQTLGPNCLYL